MSFMPKPPEAQQPIQGPDKADILLVGSHPDGHALRDGKPFSFAQENIVNTCLHQAGLISGEVVMTNFIWDRKDIESIWRSKGAKGPSQLKGNIDKYKASLWNIIQKVQPKVIVALGDITSFALTKRSKVTAIRGYPFKLADTGIIIIPSLEPNKMLHTNDSWKWYLAYDLRRAKRIANNPGIVSDWSDCKIIIPKTFREAVALLDEIERHKMLAWDIEVADFHTSCMGFCFREKMGITIPIDMRWSEQEEHYLWVRIARILENPEICKIVQNGVFDVQFMAQEMGIFVQNYSIDTMTSHHIMYPDFRKSLEFLGSIHTYYTYWKDELKEKSIKDEN